MSDADTTLDYVPVRDALAGSSEAENIRHMLVRVAFTNEFRLDERVEALCHEWGVRYGLEGPALALVETLESLAEATGMDNRGFLMDRMWSLEHSENRDQVIVDSDDSETLRFVRLLEKNQRLIDRADALANELLEKLSAVDGRGVAADSIGLVTSLGLPWPWLVLEIYEMFVYGLWGFVIGQVMIVDHWVEHPAPPAARLAFSFRTHSRETVAEALDRFVRDMLQFVDRLAGSVPDFPRGRIPSDFEDEIKNGIGRYGRWLYRRRICGESINAIARNARCDRATVRYGLREAERLLALTAFTF